jgi:hypothetical protein
VAWQVPDIGPSSTLKIISGCLMMSLWLLAINAILYLDLRASAGACEPAAGVIHFKSLPPSPGGKKKKMKLDFGTFDVEESESAVRIAKFQWE